jgi:hypothetical protein
MRYVNALSASYCTLVLIVAVWAGPAGATPLLSVQSAERCDTCHVRPDPADPKWVEANYALKDRKCRLTCGACHVNPSGGMLRTDTGMYYGTKTLPWNKDIDDDLRASLDSFRLGKNYRIGGDFRFLALYQEDREKNPALFPMQADLYAAARLTGHIGFLGQAGLERGGNGAVREAFGMADNFPYNAYLKAGKLIPPFGHRLDDHTTYVRSETAFDHSQADAYFAGVEAGAEPLTLYGRAAYFQEDLTPAAKTESARRGGSAVLGWHGLWLQLGASYMEIANFETTSTLTTDRRVAGVYGALRPHRIAWFEHLTYLFEYDFRTDEYIDPSGDTTDSDATILYNELAYRVHDGLTVKARYEVYDPDEESGESKLTRTMAGLDFHPYPFVELALQLRHTEEDGGDDNDEAFLVTHLWF